MELLKVEDLKAYYRTPRGSVHAVDGLSFTVRKGEALGIVGESGSGKTTLALAIVRLLPANAALLGGRVYFEGIEISRMPEEEFRAKVRWKGISMVFQGAMNSLNPVLKVNFQVAEPLVEGLGIGLGEALRAASDMLSKMGVPPAFHSRYPHELSGGIRQRVVIAMALIQNPKLVILDEPTSALDVSVQAQIMNLLKALKRKGGLSMIFITHDIALASDICDRIAVMYAGQIVEMGEAEEVLWAPRHPYTAGLLSSVPSISSDAPPTAIGGAPPDLAHPPSGCRFHPRCPYAFKKCSSLEPPASALKGAGFVKCWLYGGQGV